jgi:plasmid stabilization system protein ParE
MGRRAALCNIGPIFEGTFAARAPFAGFRRRRPVMPRGDKSSYTAKQDRKADHIAESYESRGVPEKEAERRAWATVNKDDGGGKKSGSGRGVETGHPAAHRGGKIGGAAAASRPEAVRSASAKKAAATHKSRVAHRAAR